MSNLEDVEEMLRDEAIALLEYLQDRGLSEREAIAVMGFAITSLITDPENIQEFISALQASHAANNAN